MRPNLPSTIGFLYVLSFRIFAKTLSFNAQSGTIMKNIAKIITELRKEKGWSQTDLAKESNVSREIIGKYERGEAVPSIDFAKRIADALGVSLDYLVGEGVNASFDKKTLTRLQEIESLQDKDREHVLALLDAFLRDVRTKKAYAH
jgi:transcriptional regulator with XRE-family HTH domain